MALTYLELAEKVLDETHTVLSPTEIWKIAENNQWSTQLEQRSKRPAGTLYGAMFTDSRDNPNSIFVRIGTRPIRYYLKKYEKDIPKDVESTEVENEKIGIPEIIETGYSEADLHQPLVYFVRTQFHAYAKTIKHARGPPRQEPAAAEFFPRRLVQAATPAGCRP